MIALCLLAIALPLAAWAVRRAERAAHARELERLTSVVTWKHGQYRVTPGPEAHR